MKLIDFTAIYVMWLREMKRTIRSKSRVIGTLAMPLFFMLFLGFGFNSMPVPGVEKGVNYLSFLVPGIIGMSVIMTATFGGLSVLWDREFGFLKEIMVAPVSRVSIVLGRIAGGMTTSVIQGVLILMFSLIFGFKIAGISQLILALIFMVLMAIAFIGVGLIFASLMKDMQGFNLIINFVIFPLFFLSGALFPLQNLPPFVRELSYLDPLTYGVDGLRGALVGISNFPLIIDFAVLVFFSAAMVALGTYLFDKSESI